MNSQSQPLEQLLAAHLSGQSVEIPASLSTEFAQAMAAHAALRGFLDETLTECDSKSTTRVPPSFTADYEIERELGHGGMGVVYLARQRSLNRHVAIKVLRPGERTYGPLVHRFLDEARHLARLRHPHIVSIHEVGDVAGEPYFTMDYIDGEPLSAVVGRGALTPSRAVEILRQVAGAIQHAHRNDIVHRDLKPGNVLVDRQGQVFVTDFGLARNVTDDTSLTQSGELLGTPQYMAPEQARGQSALIGESTDIHALGLLLFEMLAGRPAFRASSPADVLVKLLNDEPPSLRAIDRRIPRDLETICLKCLQKSPAARYPNVSALLEDIRRFESGEPLAARRPHPATAALRWLRRHWRIGATVFATVLVVTAIAPRLWDKSFAELVAWGDEELAKGQTEIAARVYSRALRRATEQEQRMLAERVAASCRSMTDSKAAVDLALQVIEVLPDASFGAHDFLVAQALVARERATSPKGAIDIWWTKPHASLELVKRRLEMALAAGVPDAQRPETENTLTAIDLVLSKEKPFVRYLPDHLHQLPTGSREELQVALDDVSRPIWDRGRAAIALGRLWEAEGEPQKAAAAYNQAYPLVRSVYPMYAGVKAAVGSGTSRAQVHDAEECQLVRQLVADIRRLSPQALSWPQGRLEFNVEGDRLPVGTAFELVLELCDTAIDNPDEGLSHNLPRLVPLDQRAPVSVSVLDGKYRLRHRGNHGRWEPNADRVARLIQIETEQWPKQIEVRGNTVQLPPVRVRLADEIELNSPTEGVAVDLAQAVLDWESISTADHYRVHLSYVTENPSPVTTYFLSFDSKSSIVRLQDLPAYERQQIRDNLLPGRTGGWRVDAYDKQGHRIGLSLNDGRFLIAAPPVAD